MHLASKVLGPDPYFKVRGVDVTRVEAICDAMFGFGVTLLIVNSSNGTSYADLLRFLRGIPAFAFSFFILVRLWYSNYQFHRRFGLEDQTTIALNLAQMFVILFFVFPLRMMIGFTDSALWAIAHKGTTRESSAFNLQPSQIAYLLEVFAGGFGLISLITALLYLHALRLKDALELTPQEVVLCKLICLENWVIAGFFLLTVLLLNWTGFVGACVAQIVAAILRRLIQRKFKAAAAKSLVPTASEVGR